MINTSFYFNLANENDRLTQEKFMGDCCQKKLTECFEWYLNNSILFSIGDHVDIDFDDDTFYFVITETEFGWRENNRRYISFTLDFYD